MNGWESSRRHRGDSCKIHARFDLVGLSGLGGVGLLVTLVRRLGLRRAFGRLSLRKAPWARYRLEDELESLLVAYMAGIERISHLEELAGDPLLCRTLGLARLPDRSTYYRLLERFDGPEAVAELAGHNRRLLDALRPAGRSCILDLDTTVLTVHGAQEGAVVGYNPRYQGRPSFQPLLAFEGRSQAVVWAWLRPGTTPSADEQAAFYRQAQQALQGAACYVRADRSFGAETMLATLEADGVGYAIKLRMTERLRACIRQGLRWRRLPSADPTLTIQVGSCHLQPPRWSRPRRVVLVRRRPVEVPQQLALWDEVLWDYEAIVTNLDWDEEDVWHFYNQRCRCENTVKDLKAGVQAGRIGKARFWPNAADLWLKILAYNALLALRALAPAPYRRFCPARLRRALITIPALLVRHARQWSLRLPAWWPHQAAYRHIRLQLTPG